MIGKLIFFKSIVNIVYNLQSQDLNPKKLQKKWILKQRTEMLSF
jgi:hypothetical protein